MMMLVEGEEVRGGWAPAFAGARGGGKEQEGSTPISIFPHRGGRGEEEGWIPAFAGMTMLVKGEEVRGEGKYPHLNPLPGWERRQEGKGLGVLEYVGSDEFVP